MPGGGRRPSARDPAPQVKPKTTKTPKHSRRGSTEAESSRPPTHERVKSSPVDSRTTEPASVVYKTHEYRDSTTSIRDDPFFRSYQSPQSIRLAKELKISQLPNDSKHISDQKGATDRLSEGTTPAPEKEGEAMREITIALLGATGVGKSTFIARALDLRQAPEVAVSSRKMLIDGVVYNVRLLKIAPGTVEIKNDRTIRWPKALDAKVMPSVDGVLTLYDVTNDSSTDKIPELMSAFRKADVPCVLVACKCDNPASARRIDPRLMEKTASAHEIDAYQTSANVPESQKRCIAALLRTIVSERPDSPRMPSRTRANTSSSTLSRPLTTTSRPKHYRASSEMTGVTRSSLRVRDAGQGSRIGPFDANAHARTGTYSTLDTDSGGQSPAQLPTSNSISNSPSTSRHSQNSQNVEVDEDAEGKESRPSSSSLAKGIPASGLIVVTDSPPRPGPEQLDEMSGNPFFAMEGEAEDDMRNPDDIPILDREADELSEREPSESGSTLEELVDRLLAQPMSKADAKFSAIFLCLYRKFAAPGELLHLIITRFENENDEDNPLMIRTTIQMRYLGIMAQWISAYRGDFAHPRTHKRMAQFIETLASSRLFAVAAKEISGHMEHVVEDDDTNWACCDKDRQQSIPKESNKITTPTPFVKSMTPIGEPESSDDEDDDEEEEEIDSSARNSGVPSNASSAATSAMSSASSAAPLSTVEDARRQAALLTPIPRTTLTKLQWHQLMELPNEDIAGELTRIDWIMYSSIRPRDLVRHVSLRLQDQAKYKALENVNRMIGQFNHVAYWVANVILLRDKPKHRARAIDKFMGIAWKLRQLNNYNSLGAVVAGLNGTSVHRLSQSHDLLPPSSKKDFMRLEILMGTQKSHFAYRLAWENSSSERIPFLPLHRRDLVSAEEGNRTFASGGGGRFGAGRRINWKKFEVMGEVVVGVQRSQGTPYLGLERNKEVQKLVLDGRFVKDDDVSFAPISSF
ncbi:MAG: hypothetical protein M1812_004209 [Candelaria pacifica]|nr:MAG: hypothetical protein M1812_004209 [Candelaria pacifica]